jgi:alkylhydroperoxidase family enzyme
VAHISLVDEPRGLLRRYAWRYSRRTFGRVVDPVRVAAHHSGVLLAAGAVETVAGKRWHSLDPKLRWLAVQATSGAVGCSWCTDFGYFEGVQQGIDPRKVHDVPRWRDSEVYDDLERAVLDYADAVNATPSAVTAAHVDRLREHLSEEQVVELAGWIALENYRSRFNAAMGLVSEGFSDSCRLRGEDAAAVPS